MVDLSEDVKAYLGDLEDVGPHVDTESEHPYKEYLTSSAADARAGLDGPDWPGVVRACQALPKERWQRHMNEHLKGVCVVGRFITQSSADVGDKVARAYLVVQRGPTFLQNRMVRIYGLRHRNRARQGDEVWAEIFLFELDAAVLDKISLSAGEAWDPLRCGCIFGSVLRAASPAMGPRHEYLCRLSQTQWRADRAVFLPFSREVPAMHVQARRGESFSLEQVYCVRVLEWPVENLHPIGQVVRSWRPAASPSRCLEIFSTEAQDIWGGQPAEAGLIDEEACEHRRDLTGVTTFTVDCAGATLLDDALEFDAAAGIVRVHIADVASLVPSGSEIDQAAASRGITLYLSTHRDERQQTYHMLPEGLAQRASLDLGERRSVITFEFSVFGDKVARRCVFRSTIVSKAKLDYRSASAAIVGEASADVPRRVVESLAELDRTTRLLMSRVVGENFRMLLRSPEFQVGTEAEARAQNMVHFWMVQVNEFAGQLVSERCANVACGLSCPLPDGVHFSRLAVVCSESLLGCASRDRSEFYTVSSDIRRSVASCQEILSQALASILRRQNIQGGRHNEWQSAVPDYSTEQHNAACAFLSMLYPLVPPAHYVVSDVRLPDWPVLSSEIYFQVTSPIRRWIDLLGQHLIFGTCRLTRKDLEHRVHWFNEKARFARACQSQFVSLSFCMELLRSERDLPCIVGRVSPSLVQLSFPAERAIQAPITLPVDILRSEDLGAQYEVEEGNISIKWLPQGEQFNLVPFRTSLSARLGLNAASPVSWNQLVVVALHFKFPSGTVRLATLPRQHPEVFGPPPDLRSMSRLHVDSSEWSRVWTLVRTSQICAAALLPQVRPPAPYHRTMTCDVAAFAWARRGGDTTVAATVPLVYRGLHGMLRLRAGHLAVVWRQNAQGCQWTGFGRVLEVTQTDAMKKKSVFCEWMKRDGSCPNSNDCWFAHSDDDLRPAYARVTVKLSPSSTNNLPAWVELPQGCLEIEFVAVPVHDQQCVQDITKVFSSFQQPQETPTLLRRLVLPKSCRRPLQCPEAPQDSPPETIFVAEGLPTLNNWQKQAMEMGLREPLGYIQGPPGTGKSTTAAHLIYALSVGDAAGQGQGSLLVCAPSNKAVDRLLQLVAMTPLPQKRRIVRVYAKSIERSHWPDPSWIGAPRDYEIAPDLEPFALHGQVRQRDPRLYQSFDEICREMHALQGGGGGKAKATPSQLQDMAASLSELKGAKEQVSKDIVSAADVIFTTCDCASHDHVFRRQRSMMRFRALLVDEAAQAAEVDLAMCCLASNEKIILVGDHLQLGPVLTETTVFPTFKSIASRSLFERVVSRKKRRGSEAATDGAAVGAIPHVTLRRQYRMHPTISEFPNWKFYEGLLLNDPTTRRAGVLLPSATRRSHVAVVNLSTPHSHMSLAPDDKTHSETGTSLCNVGEAELAKDIYLWLVGSGVPASDVAIVTPYRAQVAAIKALLVDLASELPMVGTVHLLQGEERNYVILSLVRSYACAESDVFDPIPPQIQALRRPSAASVGFLSDTRLANVALTRACVGLFVIGNEYVLSAVPLWRDLFAHARDEDAAWTSQEVRRALRGESVGVARGAPESSRERREQAASGSEDSGSEGGSLEADDREEDAFDDRVETSGSERQPDSGGEAVEVERAAAKTVPSRRRRAGKKKKQKQQDARRRGGAAGSSGGRGDGDSEDAALIAQAIAEVGESAQAKSEITSCVVQDCKKSVHSKSAVAVGCGVCAMHWYGLIKEVDFLEQNPDGVDPLQAFMSPFFWNTNPVCPMISQSFASRAFFAAVVRRLIQKGALVGRSTFVQAFETLSSVAYHEHGLGVESFPGEIVSIAERDGTMSPNMAVAIGPVLVVAALVDAGAEVPSSHLARWVKVEAAIDAATQPSSAQAPGGPGADASAEESYAEDMLAKATFHKEEGNASLREGSLINACDLYAAGVDDLGLVPEGVMAASGGLCSRVWRLRADLENNAAEAWLRAGRFEEALDAATYALAAFEELRLASGSSGGGVRSFGARGADSAGSQQASGEGKAFFRSGKAKVALGMEDEARADFEEALRLQPRDEAIREALRQQDARRTQEVLRTASQ